MIQSFIICFREFLEIAIIITIVLAATRGVSGRGRWVSIGLAGGLAGALLIAVFARNISSAMEGVGQEVFNAGILTVAMLMIIWTVVWMQSHGRALAQKMKKVGKSVSEGEVPLYSLAVVVSLAIWREGAEIVLFMTGIISSSQESMFSIIAGGIAGSGVAIVIGVALYFGLIKLSSKHLFSVTGWLLIFLACGMSAQIAGYLNAADILPAFGQIWDSSWLLSQNSVLGKILHAMLGYSERPSVIQLIFYVLTMVITLSLLKLTNKVKI
ncbi:MAG: FTR1 family protein [Rickettsiales bacterium]|jgi:high-affinity iron transporter